MMYLWLGLYQISTSIVICNIFVIVSSVWFYHWLIFKRLPAHLSVHQRFLLNTLSERAKAAHCFSGLIKQRLKLAVLLSPSEREISVSRIFLDITESFKINYHYCPNCPSVCRGCGKLGVKKRSNYCWVRGDLTSAVSSELWKCCY